MSEANKSAEELAQPHNRSALVIHRYLMAAFSDGQRVERLSDQASEFWSPHFEYDVAPKLIAELGIPQLNDLLAAKEKEMIELRAKLSQCGGDNCMGQEVEGCARWVREERLIEVQADLAAQAKELEEAKKREAEFAEGLHEALERLAGVRDLLDGYFGHHNHRIPMDELVPSLELMIKSNERAVNRLNADLASAKAEIERAKVEPFEEILRALELISCNCNVCGTARHILRQLRCPSQPEAKKG